MHLWIDSLDRSNHSALSSIRALGYNLQILSTNQHNLITNNLEQKDISWSIDFPVKDYLDDIPKYDELLKKTFIDNILKSIHRMGWNGENEVPIKALGFWMNDTTCYNQQKVGAYGWITGYCNYVNKFRIIET